MITFDRSACNMVCIPAAAAEQLLAAPPACLKVYLYGLLRGSAELSQLCEELQLEQAQAADALTWLAEAGLLAAHSTDASVLLYAGAAVPADRPPEVYQDAEFNALLQALFSDRVLSVNDFKALYECESVYGLEKKAVLVLAEACINTHRAKNRVPMSYIREEARAWAADDVLTYEQALEKMARTISDKQGVKEVLKLLGAAKKNPSEEERRLYDKWINTWGFSLESIRAAMPATAKTLYPSMKYLDAILADLHRQGLVQAGEVAAYFADRELTDRNIKEMLEHLGAPRHTVSPDMRAQYLRWQAMGFGQREMLYACKLAGARGAANLDYVATLLAGWAARGLTALPDITARLEEDGLRRSGAAELLARAGISRAVSRRDIEVYERLLRKYNMPAEVVLYAAECAYGYAAPLKAAEKILAAWQAQGIATLDAARREHAAHAQAGGKTQARFDERDYTLDQMRAMLPDTLAELEDDA